MKNKNALGMILLFITALVWGVAFVFQRTGMDHIGPITFMASRCVLAVIAIGIVNLVVNKKNAFKFNKYTLKAGLICGLFLTIANNLQQIGMVYTSAGKGGFITALYIILVPIFGWIIFKKKPEKKVWLGVALGAAGLYLLCVNEGFYIAVGDLWVLGCAFVFTGHILVTDHFAENINPVQTSFLQFVVCTVLGWILAFVFEKPDLAGIWDARIAVGYCGILSAGVGYTLQIVGQKYSDASAASLIMSLESVFAALSGWLLLNEVMSLKEICGAVLMFAAIIIVEIKPDLSHSSDKGENK